MLNSALLRHIMMEIIQFHKEKHYTIEPLNNNWPVLIFFANNLHQQTSFFFKQKLFFPPLFYCSLHRSLINEEIFCWQQSPIYFSLIPLCEMCPLHILKYFIIDCRTSGEDFSESKQKVKQNLQNFEINSSFVFKCKCICWAFLEYFNHNIKFHYLLWDS